jgi:predicted phosphodiesterase
MILGLISDTHGLLREDALAALAGVDLIVHAGDVGGGAVLAGLRELAPVEAGSPTPERLAARYSAEILVYGHTHRALVTWIGPQLVVNPGAAGPRRFGLEPSVARLRLVDGRPEVELVKLR